MPTVVQEGDAVATELGNRSFLHRSSSEYNAVPQTENELINRRRYGRRFIQAARTEPGESIANVDLLNRKFGGLGIMGLRSIAAVIL